jgi:hypothetical protein
MALLADVMIHVRTELSPSGAHSCSPDQEMSRLLWNEKLNKYEHVTCQGGWFREGDPQPSALLITLSPHFKRVGQ